MAEPADGPSEQPAVPVKMWEYLKEGIDYVMADPANADEARVGNLTRVATSYCESFPMEWGPDQTLRRVSDKDVNMSGSDLYNKLDQYFTEYSVQFNEASNAIEGEDLIRHYIVKWDHYTAGVKAINDVFAHLNENWVDNEREEGRNTIYRVDKLAVVRWRLGFFHHVQVRDARLARVLMQLLCRDRNGDTVEIRLAERLVDSFVSLGVNDQDLDDVCYDVYNEHLVTLLFEEIEVYYRTQDPLPLPSDGVYAFMKAAEERLRAEDKRAQRFLGLESNIALVNKYRRVLVGDHLELIQESFQRLLDEETDEDLQWMYALLLRDSEDLQPIRKKFEAHITAARTEAEATFLEGGEAGSDSLNLKAFAEALLEVYDRARSVRNSFQGDSSLSSSFTSNLDSACKSQLLEHVTSTMQKYYRQVSKPFIDDNKVSEFVKQAREWLFEEDRRTGHHTCAKTSAALVKSCEHAILCDNWSKILNSFRKMLDEGKDEDVQNIYALFTRSPSGCNEGIEPFRDIFDDFVKDAGSAAVASLTESTTDGLDYVAYTDALVQVHARHVELVKRNFRGDPDFIQTADRVFMGQLVKGIEKHLPSSDRDVSVSSLLAVHDRSMDIVKRTFGGDRSFIIKVDNAFRTQLAKAIEKHYAQESKAFLKDHGASEYLQRASEWLQKEDSRKDCHLSNPQTYQVLLGVCERVILCDHAKLVLENMESMLDARDDAFLQRMYNLFKRVPDGNSGGLRVFRRRFEDHVKKSGLAAVLSLSSEPLDYTAYTNSLLETHDKNVDVVKRDFAGDAGFTFSVNRAAVEYLEKPFIQKIEQHYREVGLPLLAEPSVSAYLVKVREWLLEEEERLKLHLVSSRTSGALISACERVLLRDHSERLLECFEGILDASEDSDLENLYILFKRIPSGLDPFRDRFEEIARKAGLEATGALLDADVKKTNALEPQAYVSALLQVHGRYRGIIERNFGGEPQFVASLDKACREFINTNPAVTATNVSSSVLLAKLTHCLLGKSKDGLDIGDLEGEICKVIVIFKYLDDKDAFLEAYTSNLAKRLLLSASVSDTAESSIIAKMKEVCGFECTRNMERMIADIETSKVVTAKFKDEYRLSDEASHMDFSILVLASRFWPIKASTQNLVVPKHLSELRDGFEKFYDDTRKLTWLWNHSTTELRTSYLSRQYTLATSVYQMAVLVQYNDADSFSLKQLAALTAINKDVLLQVVFQLTKATVLLPVNGDRYELNLTYKAKKTRVNLNAPIKAEAKASATSTTFREEERKFIYQAAVVRILKAAKTMKDQLLIEQVLSHAGKHGFTPKKTDIEKVLDMLLDKEYIERVDGARDTFSYVA